ncbi:MAG: metallopeptidase TldD-related protein [Candidatus Acidiferrales bacterium]
MSATAIRARHRSLLALGTLFFSCALPAAAQHKDKLPPNVHAASAASDPILQAMREELARSKAQLKMDNVPGPYYIEYRISDVEGYEAEAAFGALRESQRSHQRIVRVVVRVGDYKQDSYFGQGMGAVDLAPLDNNPIALRRQIWLASDQAYKAASEALANKKALLSQYTKDQPFDDFAPAPPLESIAPLARLEFDASPWEETIGKATALFRSDPKIQSLSATVRFRAQNQYFVNTEGTVTRTGHTVYFATITGSTQAADGMRLDRSPYYSAGTLREMPTAEKFQADTVKMLETLKKLREAPVVEEEYRGPVLFSSDASSDIFNGMIGANVVGRRPKPGESARTQGAFSSSYKSRVLPAFLSIADDPTLKTFDGKTLVGSYEIDDEGVRAAAVAVITNGELENYLLGREPIRDFPASNGHGRAAPGQPPVPSVGNLIVQSKETSSPEELKKKLMAICHEQGKPYGYFVDTLSGFDPRLLYRVYENDGHEELVRGAVFNELDVRTLRNNLIAVGNDPLVSNRDSQVPSTVIAPSILFDELEVKRTDAKNAKLPEYPPPDLAPSK